MDGKATGKSIGEQETAASAFSCNPRKSDADVEVSALIFERASPRSNEAMGIAGYTCRRMGGITERRSKQILAGPKRGAIAGYQFEAPQFPKVGPECPARGRYSSHLSNLLG